MARRIAIIGVGKCLPKKVVNNAEILKILAANGVTTTNSGKPLTEDLILKTSGISERRRIAEYDEVSDLALVAAEDALNKADIWWEDLSIIRVGTSTPEAAFPSTACITLMKAGAPEMEASDVLAACTSGVYALIDVQSRLLAEPGYKYGLVIGAEAIASRLGSPTDINYDLWGDGAGAVVLMKCPDTFFGPDEPIIYCSMARSVPSMADKAISIGLGTRSGFEDGHRGAWLAGTDIHKFILELLPKVIPETLEKANRQYFRPNGLREVELGDLDQIFLHQANGRIFEFVAKQLDLPIEKFYQNVAKYGNTSSAGVFIALCEAIEESIVGPGSLVLLAGFGGGLTYATALIRL